MDLEVPNLQTSSTIFPMKIDCSQNKKTHNPITVRIFLTQMYCLMMINIKKNLILISKLSNLKIIKTFQERRRINNRYWKKMKLGIVKNKMPVAHKTSNAVFFDIF